MCPSPASKALRPVLDRLYTEFNVERSVADPVWIVHRYERPDDREVAAFIASSLAVGRVQSVLNSVDGML